jgi:nucleotide-binding universal stress UspA family protein
MHAFQISMDMAKKYNSQVTILYCLQTDFRVPWYGFDSRMGNAIKKKQKDIALKNIAQLESNAKKAGVKVSSKISESHSIVKTLVSFAESNNISLIVMGSHGRTGFDKLLLGSVAHGVSHRARCPVLIVK